MVDPGIGKVSPVARLTRVPSWLWMVGVVLVVYVIISTIMLNARPDVEVQFRLSLGPLVLASTIVQVHVAGAFLAFLVGLGHAGLAIWHRGDPQG